MIRSEEVRFAGSHGELVGTLDWPDGPIRSAGLFAHCFTCSKDVVAASRIARELSRRGILVLRFDFTGLGASDGDFAATTFSSDTEDLVRAAGFLRENHGAPALLVGHSLGGAAVIAAANRIPEVGAVATIGAPACPSHVTNLFADDRETIETAGETTVQLGGRPFRIRREFVEDLERQPQDESIAHLGCPLLVLHAPGDDIVGIDNARRLFESARHPKSFISLDNADHLLRRPADSAYAASLIATWADRYLPAAAPGTAQ